MGPRRVATAAPGRFPATGVALWVRAILGAGYLALALHIRSWFFAVLGLLYVAVPVAMFVVLRRTTIQVPVTPEGVGTIISRANAVAAAAAKPPADDVEAVERLRWLAAGGSADSGTLDRRLAAFALAQAQRQVSAGLGVGRRRALVLLDRARREALVAAQLPEAR